MIVASLYYILMIILSIFDFVAILARIHILLGKSDPPHTHAHTHTFFFKEKKSLEYIWEMSD